MTDDPQTILRIQITKHIAGHCITGEIALIDSGFSCDNFEVGWMTGASRFRQWRRCDFGDTAPSLRGGTSCRIWIRSGYGSHSAIHSTSLNQERGYV
jgi:hypothetical protein